jgi:1-acyl-sn-glycerol-3-phosphate acyltransferase
MQTAQPRPLEHSSLTQRIAHALLKMAGWREVNVPPPGPKGILIVYPHTSNWDFIIGMLFKFSVNLRAHWLGKDNLFRWPFRNLLVSLGGIPVNRRERSGYVDNIRAQFEQREWMWLAMAPEGTRAYTDHWKSGFYQIALAAGLPIGLAYIDYATRSVGVDTYLTLTGDPERDFEAIRSFYAPKRGRRHELASTIRLRGS